MKRLQQLLVALILFPAAGLQAQKEIRLGSPDGRLQFRFRMVGHAPQYSVQFKETTLIEYSTLSLQFEDGGFGNNLKQGKPVFRHTTEA